MQFINKHTKLKISSILSGKKKASPVPHLLKTNDMPSDLEIIFVQDALLKAREELEVLEYQLERETTTHQDALHKGKKNYQKFIRTHTAILSLTRRIPDDILATIFEEVAFSPRAYYSHPPWSLSQVCRNWRAIALSLPHLWKCIDLKLDGEKRKTHAFVTYLTNHLNRSKQVPLDVFVSCSSSVYNYVRHPYIAILCQYAQRWGSLSAEVPGATLHAFASVKGRLKVLHSAVIILLSPGPYQSGTPLDMFEDAPELRRFSIGSHPPSLCLHLPWSQLLSYQNMFCGRVGVANVLTSPRLQRLALIHKVPYDDLVPLPTVTLNNLRQLYITFNTPRSQQDNIPTGYLDGLTLPALEELRFTNYGIPNTNILTALIKRSHCIHLTSLEFAPLMSFEPGELSGLLRLVPQLINLITLMPDIYDIDELILQGDSSKDLVPSLQKLIFHTPYLLRPIHCRVIAALATSRCETARSMYLRIVTYDVRFWHGTHEDLEAAFAPERVPDASTRRNEILNTLKEMKCCIEALHLLLRTLVQDSSLVHAPDIAAPLQAVMKQFEKCMEELMVTLEKYQFDDHWKFHEAGLHHLLYHIIQVIECEAEKIGQHGSFLRWKKRGEEHLDKWNKLYVLPFFEHRRWGFQGLHSFVYVPLNHDSRQVNSGVLRMVYGKTFFVDKYYTQYAAPPQVPSQLTYRD